MNTNSHAATPIYKVILGVIVAAIILGTSGFLLVSGKVINGRLYFLVPDYNYINPNIPVMRCQAHAPMCGYCIDEVHPDREAIVQNEKCYRSL
jgi:hypothetical protein